MSILFAAGDPGGANALRPVIAAVSGQGACPWVLASGAFAGPQSFPDSVRLVEPPALGIDLGSYLSRMGITHLCFATSLKDVLPLRLARAAAEMGCTVVTVLDNWVNYQERISMDGQSPLIPDIYAVMDELAYTEAVADGIPPSCLRVTGHPNLGSLATDWAAADDTWRQDFRRSLGLGVDGRELLAFVNEPVAHDQGTGPDHPGWRGYTEHTVLASLGQSLRALQTLADVMIIPHPRDDRVALAQIWADHGAGQPGRVVDITGRQGVLAADRVVGMASIMLYEAWLVGRPTLSLQPGLVRDDLLSIAMRPGIVLARTKDQVLPQVERWLTLPQVGPLPDLARHSHAARQVADALMESS